MREDWAAEAGGDGVECGFGKQLRGDARGEREEFTRGIEHELLRGVIAFAGETENRGRQRGDLAVGIGVVVEETRDSGGVGGVAELRVIANGGTETRSGC